jgi:thiol-disulfide isomerase/thioredoxin
MDRRERDMRFLIQAIAVSFLLMALMQAFAPYLEEAQLRAEDKLPDIQTVPITAERLPGLVMNGKPTMLVVYASWCSVCRSLLPEIIALQNQRRLDFMNRLFVSIDDVPPHLRTYLARQGYGGAFTPYIMQYGDHRRIMDVLGKNGVRYEGKIPYVAFFNRQGNVVAHFAGLVTPDQFMALAEKAK